MDKTLFSVVVQMTQLACNLRAFLDVCFVVDFGFAGVFSDLLLHVTHDGKKNTDVHFVC